MTDQANPIGWMLDDVLKMPETRHAVLVAGDGLLLGRSQRIPRDDAERTSASISGLQSLSRSMAEFCEKAPTDWRQTLVEFDGGYAFLIAAGDGAYLAVSTTDRVDMEGIASRLQHLVQRLGQELTAPDRFAGQGLGSPA